MQITRSSIDTGSTVTGSTATGKGPAEWFTGDVYIDAVAAAEATSTFAAANVHFTPGARTAWHTHPHGQTIFVTEGVGLCNKATSDTCSHTFKSRLLYQFAGLAGLGALEPGDVQSAVFAVTGTHSYSCTPMPVTLYAVADFDQGTSYPGGPQWDALQTQTITHRSGCGAGREPRRIEFDLKLARVDDHLAEGGGGVDPWPDDDFWEWWI